MNNTHTQKANRTPTELFAILQWKESAENAVAAKVADGTKFEARDMDHGLRTLFTGYAFNYSGSFDFMVKMSHVAKKAHAGRGASLTDGQLKGIGNCYLADQKRNAKVKPAPMPVGVHKLGDTIYRVKMNQHGTRTYAYEAMPGGNGGWQYVGQVVGITVATLLTLDEAIAIGHSTGNCIICNRLLTVPKSVKRGIGPVCAKKPQFA